MNGGVGEKKAKFFSPEVEVRITLRRKREKLPTRLFFLALSFSPASHPTRAARDTVAMPSAQRQATIEEMGLKKLDVSYDSVLGAAPEDVAFPRALGGMKSLRELELFWCGLRTVPAFVGELSALERLDLSCKDEMQIDAPLVFLLEGCPGMREVKVMK